MTVTELLRKVESFEPELRRAYLESVRQTVGSATVEEVERLLEQEDESGLIRLLGLGALAVLIEGVRSAFIGGGRYEITAIIIPRMRREFDPAMPAAQAALSTQVESLRAQVTSDLREVVQGALSSRTQAGGFRTNRQAALDLVGRISPQTGRRIGGAVGLPGNMADYVQNARRQLLSGDPSLMRQYLKRVRRDRRFDGLVRRAIKNGAAVKAADVDRITGQYSNRLLMTHAEMLSSTTAAESFHAGRDLAWEQMVAGGVARERIVKEWRDRGDEKVRNSHRHMRGERVSLGDPFYTSSGAMLRYPGDTALGAGYDEVCNCRCACIYHLEG